MKMPSRLKNACIAAIVCTVSGLVAALMPPAVRGQSQLPDGIEMSDRFEPGAGEPVGLVVALQGTGVVLHSESMVGFSLRKDLPVYEGDTIVTMRGALASIQMRDGSQFALSSDTKIVISKSLFDEKRKERATLIGMGFGKVRFFIKKLAGFKRSDVKVKTKTAILGVRGSDFVVVSTLDYTRIVTLFRTVLEVIGVVAPEIEPAVLSDFEKTVIRSGGIPSEIERVGMEEAQSIQQELPLITDQTVLTRNLSETRDEMRARGIRVEKKQLMMPPTAQTSATMQTEGLAERVRQAQVAEQEQDALTQESLNREEARTEDTLGAPAFPEPPMTEKEPVP